MFGAESFLSFALLSPSIYSRWFRANGHTNSLLTLIFPSAPPHLFYPNSSKSKGEWTFPSMMAAPTPPWTLLCHRGRMDITSVHWSPPCFLPVLQTFAKRSAEPMLPFPSAASGGRCQLNPAATRPDHRPWPASVTQHWGSEIRTSSTADAAVRSLSLLKV